MAPYFLMGKKSRGEYLYITCVHVTHRERKGDLYTTCAHIHREREGDLYMTYIHITQRKRGRHVHSVCTHHTEKERETCTQRVHTLHREREGDLYMTYIHITQRKRGRHVHSEIGRAHV